MSIKLNRKGAGLAGEDRVKENQNLEMIEREFNSLDAVKEDSAAARLSALEALAKADAADSLSKNVQTQLNTIVVEGDSSPQATQASVGARGEDYGGNLKARLDAEFNETAAQLAETAQVLEDIKKGLFEITPEMFGAIANGVENDTAAYEMCLDFSQLHGGALIKLASGKSYRIGSLKKLPNNTHIVATGAFIKAPDTSNGTCLIVGGVSGSISENCSLTGGIFSGNWEGGGGVISHNGQVGNQPGVLTQYSRNARLENVISMDTVNDGINGHYNTNLTLINCKTMNTGEHGFYIGYSSHVRWISCEVLNQGLNTWGKGSVMIKMRQARHYYVNDFIGSNDALSTNATDFTEGTGEHIYLKNVQLRGIKKLFNFTEAPVYWGNKNHNIRISGIRALGLGDSLFTISNLSESTMKDCVFENFNRVGFFGESENVKFSKCVAASPTSSLGATRDDNIELVKIKEVTLEDCEGYISFYGKAGSVFESIRFIGDKAPTNNRIYADKTSFRNIFLKRSVKPDTHSLFQIYDVDCDFEKISGENVDNLVRNNSSNTLAGKKVLVRDALIKNGQAALRDDSGSPKTWNAIGITTVDTPRAFYTGTGSVINYGLVLRMGSTTALSFGPGTLNKVSTD